MEIVVNYKQTDNVCTGHFILSRGGGVWDGYAPKQHDGGHFVRGETY